MVWPHRFYIVVAADDREAANRAAATIDPGGYGESTFCVPLSVDGSSPPTAFGCNTAATEFMRLLMLGALPTLPSVMFWQMDPDLNLGGTNVGASIARVGHSTGWAEALADVGLLVIEGET